MFNFKKKLIIKFSLLSSVIILSSQTIAEPTITSADKVGDIIELTVNNSNDFSVGALPYVLKIGDSVFKKSRSPSNGDLNTLIFLIPSDTFDQLKEDDLVNLGYGDVEDNLVDLDEVSAGKTIKNGQKTSAQSLNPKRKWALGGFKKQQLSSKN